MFDPNSPLNEGHLQQINNALDAAKTATAQIEMAKRAGVDVGSLEAANNANIDKLRLIKQVYFAGM